MPCFAIFACRFGSSYVNRMRTYKNPGCQGFCTYEKGVPRRSQYTCPPAACAPSPFCRPSSARSTTLASPTMIWSMA